MTWDDVDWAEGTLRVRSSKTEHHDGHAVRVVPMFPELRSLLMDAFDAAPDRAKYVITRYRDAGTNLRTQFRRIIKRAGFEPWPRLWQNLRASRETELMRSYDLATVCRWIGNSPAVAAKHYAMSTDLNADFQRAIALTEAQQKAQQSPSARHVQAMTSKPGDDTEPPENTRDDATCQAMAFTGKSEKWAIQDSNL